MINKHEFLRCAVPLSFNNIILCHDIGTDLSEEITKVQRAIHKHFTVEKLRPIYDPDEFREFCLKAGAKTLFDNIWKGMTSERHSENRMAMKKKVSCECYSHSLS